MTTKKQRCVKTIILLLGQGLFWNGLATIYSSGEGIERPQIAQKGQKVRRSPFLSLWLKKKIWKRTQSRKQSKAQNNLVIQYILSSK